MPTKARIKNKGIAQPHASLDAIYQGKTKIQLEQWLLNLAEHILALVGYDYGADPVVQEGFAANRQWQAGTARMFDVRQAVFKVHQLAKASNDTVVQAALRVAGQAVGTEHMREHAMVASDYAIETINLKYPNDMNVVKAEREWQIAALK